MLKEIKNTKTKWITSSVRNPKKKKKRKKKRENYSCSIASCS